MMFYKEYLKLQLSFIVIMTTLPNIQDSQVLIRFLQISRILDLELCWISSFYFTFISFHNRDGFVPSRKQDTLWGDSIEYTIEYPILHDLCFEQRPVSQFTDVKLALYSCDAMFDLVLYLEAIFRLS